MWTPSLQTFRVLNAVSLTTYLLLVAEGHWGFFPKTPDEEFALRSSGVNASLFSDQAARLHYLLVAMHVCGFVGMWFLQDLGRWIALTAVCGNVFSGFAFGVSVWTPAVYLIGSISGVAIDLTIAIAFLSPIALRFDGNATDATKSNSADG